MASPLEMYSKYVLAIRLWLVKIVKLVGNRQVLVLFLTLALCDTTTQHSTVEEGLEQMSSVQDNVIKRMEQNVEQLTKGNIMSSLHHH